MEKHHPIDFIITWVDGNDPAWQAEKARYKKTEGDARASRYREWDTLRYWFRGVERFAPWVDKIHFVTWGHLPEWLNTEHPKLRIVNHRDYIPEEYLPTFSSRPIDMNFHRIDDLAEHFVYFNDDMFLLRPVEPEDFFQKGLPCDAAVQDVVVPKGKDDNGDKLVANSLYTAVFYDTVVINRNFDKKTSVKSHWRKWFSLKYGRQMWKNLLLSDWNFFTGFKVVHLPYSYLKETYREVWEKEAEILSTACQHRFRTATDVNHYVFSYWQFAKGTFMPRDLSIGSLMSICNDEAKNRRIYRAIRRQNQTFLCINDQFSNMDYEETNRNLVASFQTILSEKSVFEK